MAVDGALLLGEVDQAVVDGVVGAVVSAVARAAVVGPVVRPVVGAVIGLQVLEVIITHWLIPNAAMVLDAG